MVNELWEHHKRSVLANAEVLANDPNYRPLAAEIRAAAKSHCNQPPPSSDAELQWRMTQDVLSRFHLQVDAMRLS